jgi:hypothetical protein
MIESFIGLVYTKRFNSAFFSKELGIPNYLVDLISQLARLKLLATKKRSKVSERVALYEQIVQSQSSQKAIRQLKIDPHDLVAVLRLFYNDTSDL